MRRYKFFYYVIIFISLIILDFFVPRIVLANNVENNELNNDFSIKYTTHVQGIGWQREVKSGEMAGTSGKGLRLEAIKIDTINAPENVKIKYKVHVEGIGWQNWKTNGEMAGTSGKGLRLEAINIKLENTEEYSIKYRVHVQNIGWQEWRYDGEIAGTEGKSLRLEAIEIKIEPKTKRGILKIETPSNNEEINKNNIKISGWCMTNTEEETLKVKLDGNEITSRITRKNRSDVLGTTGGYGGEEANPNAGYETQIDLTNEDDGIHTITIELYSDSNKLNTKEVQINLDRSMKVLYTTHVQGIGWQREVKSGEMAGTVGKALRIEAIKINLLNAPENIKVKYRAHIEGIGWQSWKSSGEIAGTTGKGLRIEALDIMLVDKYTNKEIDNMTIEYNAHIQGIGWQKEKIDGETAGTTGEGLRIEAIKIKLVNTKLPRGKVEIEKPTRTVFTCDSITIYGWEMSTQSENSILEFYMDGRPITNEPIRRTSRTDIQNAYSFYGDKNINPNPGFELDLNFNNYSSGQHTLLIKLYSSDRSRLLDSTTKNIAIIKNIYFGVDVSKWQDTINWTRVKQEGVNYAIIRVGYGQTINKNKDVFFEANYRSCVANGIPVGVYLYSYALNVEEARLEAQAALAWLNGRSLQLPVFWDTEDACQKGIDRNTLTAMADTFCSIIENAGYGYQAGIYGSKYWLRDRLDMRKLENKYDVWVAQYYKECTYDGRYDIWQYSSEGRVSGINGKVDCNWFYKKY